MIQQVATTAAAVIVWHRGRSTAVVTAVHRGHTVHVGRSRGRRHNTGVQSVQCGDLQAGRGRASADDEGHGFPLSAVTVVTGRRIVPAASADSIVQTFGVPIEVLMVFVWQERMLLKSNVTRANEKHERREKRNGTKRKIRLHKKLTSQQLSEHIIFK